MIHFFNTVLGKIFFEVAVFRLKRSQNLKMDYGLVKLNIDSILDRKFMLPDKIIFSILCIEDRRFNSHLGVDFYSIIRAMKNYFVLNRLEGASTIEQQFVRSITGNKRISFKRKVDEICLALLLGNEYKKNEILTSYLLTYKFNNIQGIEKLCQTEKIKLKKISRFEAASIAARLKYPCLTKGIYIKYLKRVRTIEIKQWQ